MTGYNAVDFRAVREAIWASALRPAPRIVALRLVEHLPHIAPSVASLAEHTGYERCAVMSALRQLERLGCIEIVRIPGRRSEYRFTGRWPERPHQLDQTTCGSSRPVAETDQTSRRDLLPPVDASDTKQVREADKEAERASTAVVRPQRRKPRSPGIETPIPDNWEPTPSHRRYAAENNLNLAAEAVAYRGWAEGRTALSWNGTFTTRLANQVKWRSERQQLAAQTRASHVEPFGRRPAEKTLEQARREREASRALEPRS